MTPDKRCCRMCRGEDIVEGGCISRLCPCHHQPPVVSLANAVHICPEGNGIRCVHGTSILDEPPVASGGERVMGVDFGYEADPVEVSQRKDRPECMTANGKLICYCGKCVPEDYSLPKDFPAQPSPSWEGTINDAPFTAPDCWSKFDKDLRHTLDAFFNDMSEGAVATIKQHVRELLLSERERIVVEVEKIIERERFAGAPHALNEVIKLLRQS